MGDWPFADPPNLAVLTVRQIVRNGEPVMYVSHDADDGSWQFLPARPVPAEDAMVVGLRGMVERDPSLTELADLPPGGRAWRDEPGSPWRRLPPDGEPKG